ncbi:MAG: hypothetical protein OXE95_11065 [Chloroflexi bacterium]|nr:hypothetical protein [Chloroflexota bacterium]
MRAINSLDAVLKEAGIDGKALGVCVLYVAPDGSLNYDQWHLKGHEQSEQIVDALHRVADAIEIKEMDRLATTRRWHGGTRILRV